MPTVEELIDRARKNEEIARRLFDIEVQIMNIGHCSDFFDQLLTLVAEKFNIEHVWVSLTDSPINDHILRSICGDREQEQSSALHVMATMDFLQATQSSREPILINDGFKKYRYLIPQAVYPKLGSMAILPLVVDGKIIGSLNLGDNSPDRYEPSKDSFFLKQLAVKASISLAGVSIREKISFLATRDPLTLLRNRREMEESLERELSRSRRHHDPLALVFIDCDDFKLVNDTYGHDCGDLYLKYVANKLIDMTRKGDMVFRFAGDEFVLVLPNQNTADAEMIAGRIKDHLSASPLMYRGLQVSVSISYGSISTDQLVEPTHKTLLKAADEKLYQMKKHKPPRCSLIEAFDLH
ncbi:diguanylate cyclase [Alkalimarinus sediminis]|uniref:diguanylate cyclase n=1 Tax=Alkalimarinus sediminis TaxID=1632866 RepID=A0A9E8KQC5_9ALTE|nr:DUF484 family protein [Alkalimarinus sediminis]UZW75679.1 DUF484 family protein [Alkalimarinus sediminis]